MPIPLINSDVKTGKRYDFSRFLPAFQGADDSLYWDSVKTRFFLKLQTLRSVGTKIVTIEENRPDLLAYGVYGSVTLWWVLCFYNAIEDPSDIPAGTSIKYPTHSDLEALYFEVAAEVLTDAPQETIKEHAGFLQSLLQTYIYYYDADTHVRATSLVVMMTLNGYYVSRINTAGDLWLITSVLGDETRGNYYEVVNPADLATDFEGSGNYMGIEPIKRVVDPDDPTNPDAARLFFGVHDEAPNYDENGHPVLPGNMHPVFYFDQLGNMHSRAASIYAEGEILNIGVMGEIGINYGNTSIGGNDVFVTGLSMNETSNVMEIRRVEDSPVYYEIHLLGDLFTQGLIE